MTRWQRLRSRIWILFDEPYSSSTAKCIACASVFFICLSVLCFCLKSHAPKSKPEELEDWNGATAPHRAFFYLEHACNAWFTIEIAIRCLVRFFNPSLMYLDALGTQSSSFLHPKQNIKDRKIVTVECVKNTHTLNRNYLGAR